MGNFDWAVIISILWVGVYLLFVFSARRQEITNRVTQSLIIYAFLSTVWEVLWVVNRWGLFDFAKINFNLWLISFGVITLALIFLVCTILFWQVKSGFLAWVGISAGFAGMGFIGLVSLLPLPESVRILFFAVLVAGWMAAVVLSCYITYTAFHQAKKRQYRNRVGYWGLALTITILGDLVLLAGVIRNFGVTAATDSSAGFWVVGSTLHMLGILIAGYVVLIHNAIDLIWGLLRLLSYVSVTILGIFLVVVVMRIDLSGISFLKNASVDWIIKAVILVVLVVPVLSWSYRYANRLVFGTGVDRDTAVREYSLSISNLIDFYRLAEISLGFLDKTLGVEFSLLLIVENLPQEDYYQLDPITNPLKTNQVIYQPGRIHSNGVLARHFFRERSCLTQYDLDLLPKFKNSVTESEWLTSFQAELFVPILTKETWLGLFVLGPKKSGDRFFGDDIDLLNILAYQTVAALQNARLFSDLRKLNDDLRQTYRELEQANQKLLEIDEMKSAFISVVTHEMRTPLANMGFAMQVLEISGAKNFTPEQLEQLNQITDGIKASRSMIDNMITLAALLNKQVELQLEKLDFQEILDRVTPMFSQKAGEKNVNFKVDQVGDASLVGDRKLLMTAVSHLIENALKFTDQGGSVWISSWTTSDALWLDVRDTGQGIEEEKLDTVWQSFTQQVDSVRRGVEGLGLGLSLVKLIVLAHGGQVFVESEIGSGSVFGFRIPLKGPNYPLKAVPSEPSRKIIPGLQL